MQPSVKEPYYHSVVNAAAHTKELSEIRFQFDLLQNMASFSAYKIDDCTSIKDLAAKFNDWRACWCVASVRVAVRLDQQTGQKLSAGFRGEARAIPA